MSSARQTARPRAKLWITLIEQPAVINGCSELFEDIFGEDAGVAASALGTNSLPGGIAVEIEAIFEITDE